MTNFFDFYQLPVTFNIDESALKKKFLANSKRFHPDFYTLAAEATQNEILELATLNNQAYKTLNNKDTRLQHLLEIHDALDAEGEAKLPQDFLMDMMDINEGLMDLEFDFDAAHFQAIQATIKKFESDLYENVAEILEKPIIDKNDIKKVKDFYLKTRYLLRIKENLSKFAARL
jgi:molecular chaperone HscB